MKNLAKAVIQVMKEVKGMEKNSRVGAGTRSAYDGTKDQDVKEVFNKALADAGLCILPTDIDEETFIERWEETNQYGTKMKQSVFTKVKTKYLLIHDSGESVELSGYGHGVDTQDKGAGKATTYAMKNCLLLSFLTPVGKIDDTDATHSQDHAVPTAKKPDSVPTPKRLTDDMKKKMLDWTNPEHIQKVLDTFVLTAKEKKFIEGKIKDLTDGKK